MIQASKSDDGLAVVSISNISIDIFVPAHIIPIQTEFVCMKLCLQIHYKNYNDSPCCDISLSKTVLSTFRVVF